MAKTIQETVGQLHTSLVEYIEAAYHIGNPQLIAQRRSLLEQLGVIHQSPYIESTPRYKTGSKFRDIDKIPEAALELFEILARPRHNGKILFYDPPYMHQAESIKNVLVESRNVVIMTGTGSGKTESFLLPILGKLAREARANPSGFKSQDGMRALILYPMNALVNDQLGRLRAIFGDSQLVDFFNKCAGRPPRFARYTSRTPYAGVRTSTKDSTKLKSFRDFYIRLLQQTRSSVPEEQAEAQKLLDELVGRGKWPAKPDLEKWFGAEGSAWQSRQSNEFKRAVTLPGDSELITRHEVQACAPDLVVTNYSMLEYMLMRPIERSIFDSTRDWLNSNPSEKFLLVLDEAHLYRGAAGAEVGLLLRRLRDRLGVDEDRFQVICATASFDKTENAPSFGSKLAGVPAESFDPIKGDLDLRQHSSIGTTSDAAVLSSLEMNDFYSEEPELRNRVISTFLKYRNVSSSGNVEHDLYDALHSFPPLDLLVNSTMQMARPIEELGRLLFPDTAPRIADLAATNLASLASTARKNANEPSLLPCRVHNFFRGLRGLWVCMDPQCTEIPAELHGVGGKLYSQPREACDCGSRVLELYTCRYCGTAYARGYSESAEDPHAIWPEPGSRMRMAEGDADPLVALDILLEEPRESELAEVADYDIETGQINPAVLGDRNRKIYLRPSRVPPPVSDDDEQEAASFGARGTFQPCAICQQSGQRGRSTVQDHETKGDQPFQVLLARQLQIQPPGLMPASSFAPLRGRKVLAFSDSRQVAARLAPNLQMYSARDSLRPLLVRGLKRLNNVSGLVLRLDDLYCAVLLAANELGVRLRPELNANESFSSYEMVGKEVKDGAINSDSKLRDLCVTLRGDDDPPESLLGDIIATLQDRSLGLEALAVASIGERADKTAILHTLPSIPGVADTPDKKVALARAWIRYWHRAGFWLKSMPGKWYQGDTGGKLRVLSSTGAFKTRMDRLLGSPAARKIFKNDWLPLLLQQFAENMGGKKHRLLGKNLALYLDGEWVRCADCKSVHRPIPGLNRCLDCGHDAITPLNPEKDEVFIARKGYYRRSIIAALMDPPEPPMALIAAEHTAQLNSPQNEDVFSKAEENELLFQDVELTRGTERSRPSAIDVLSSTTTMEVGIDIGQLSGVALRNMPPGRANYQQRAGRAGRRGNAVATVIAFGGSDTHDEHYFAEPDEMIRGSVVDPILSLDNAEIAKRHIRAFLIQSYHQARLPAFDPNQPHDLFSVLGTVVNFKSSSSILNRDDFEAWTKENEDDLRRRVATWIPKELTESDRQNLLSQLASDCIDAIDVAINDIPSTPLVCNDNEDDDNEVEVEPEVDEELPVDRSGVNKLKLLDWLLYKGVLPRYAFPTDVATFHVFDREQSTRYRPIMRFAPSQGLPAALSQYAPGKQVWISGKCYTSGAIYSPLSSELFKSWQNRRLHLECSECGYAYTTPLNQGINVKDVLDCSACGSQETVGPARYWVRPPGFAHPVDIPEVTSPDDMPETSYATRAKLTMKSPADQSRWNPVTGQIRVLTERTHLLVSNTGPSKDGYTYCTKCGRIEASTTERSSLFAPHLKPYPDEKEPQCTGASTSTHIVLGTDFITDVALFSLSFQAPVNLMPTSSVTQVALRTVSEALARAASDILQIEPGEVMAEFRPALTQAGISGFEAEIFLYDTLPGGAGFARNAAADGVNLFEQALKIMRECEEDCDSSCYRCLRNFRNKIEHGLLDRHVGAALIEYLLSGNVQPFNQPRIEASTSLLFADLLRQGFSGLTFDCEVDIQGIGSELVRLPIRATRHDGNLFAIALTAPLTENVPADIRLVGIEERVKGIRLILVNELMVRKNLPAATATVVAALRKV
jgi:ATP-dependent helicase YprA (DUF1998 family)